jgi:glycogen debranching enzyme
MSHAATFNVRDIPFSTFGSWLDISPVIAQNAYADDLHLVSHQGGMHPVLCFAPLGPATRAGVVVQATPSLLSWRYPQGHAEATYESPDTIRVRGAGVELQITAAASRLTPFSGSYFHRDPVDGAYVFTTYETGRRYRVSILSGTVRSLGDQALGEAERGLVLGGGTWEVAIEEYESARAPYAAAGTFEETAAATAAAFTRFADAVAPWRSERTPAAELACYVLWSATVRPAGFLARPAVLMSKHWMDKVWSWDHCFNALALAAGEPDLAWDQYKLIFDHQDPMGGLPDSVTHSEVLYNFVKPPIHGWALSKLRAIVDLSPEQLKETYDQLARWTAFWMDTRRGDREALPHYQHGNDSGWDNATPFDTERVAQTADLPAFLVLQMRELAELAALLGEHETAEDWTKNAGRLRDDLLGQLWTTDRFATRSPRSGATWTSASLLDLMPIVLGAELPGEITSALAGRIAGHLTAHGLATERPDSPRYQSDGYWRGPVWAPATVLIEDGLRRAGHSTLADDISARFRTLCETSGFAENFDALTGAGLRDRAYTWTASGYLLLAAAHERRCSR